MLSVYDFLFTLSCIHKKTLFEIFKDGVRGSQKSKPR